MNKNNIKIPHANMVDGVIPEEIYQNMREVLELVYEDIENDVFDEKDEKKFYRGECKISWNMLYRNCDVRHISEVEIKETIKKSILDNKRSILQIKYEPGVGGTTFLRRLAYLLHNENPTVIVEKYYEKLVAEYIFDIYNRSRRAIAILVDNNNLTSTQVEQLYMELRSNYTFTFQIIYVTRMNEQSSSDEQKRLILFNPNQCKEMKMRLEPLIESDTCLNNLEDCINKEPFDEEHKPFILALYAFDENFKGVPNFVRHSMSKLSHDDSDICFVLALSDYANNGVDMQFFRACYTSSKVRYLRNSNTLLSPLIKVVNDANEKQEYCRIRYF